MYKLKKIKKLFFFIITIFTIIYLYANNQAEPNFNTSISTNKEVSANEKITNSFNEKNICYYITDCFDEYNQQSLSDFLQSDSLQNLKNFNKVLNETFDFVEITSQFLETDEYYTKDKKFTTSYGMKKDLTNQKIEIDGKTNYITALNAIQINHNKIFKGLENKIELGRFFIENDFNYNEGDSVPIILGYEYKDIYNLKEHINLNYLFKPIDFEVIGFFKKNTNIVCGNQVTLLDNYICMPHFNIINTPQNFDDELFQKRYYLQKNSGYIIIPELSQVSLKNSNKEAINKDYKNRIKYLSEENNLPYQLFEYEFNVEIK